MFASYPKYLCIIQLQRFLLSANFLSSVYLTSARIISAPYYIAKFKLVQNTFFWLLLFFYTISLYKALIFYWQIIYLEEVVCKFVLQLLSLIFRPKFICHSHYFSNYCFFVLFEINIANFMNNCREIYNDWNVLSNQRLTLICKAFKFMDNICINKW